MAKHRDPNPMLRQDTDRACYLAQWGRGWVLCVLPLDLEHVYGLSTAFLPLLCFCL